MAHVALILATILLGVVEVFDVCPPILLVVSDVLHVCAPILSILVQIADIAPAVFEVTAQLGPRLLEVLTRGLDGIGFRLRYESEPLMSASSV
jgi:hypothetical protein